MSSALPFWFDLVLKMDVVKARVALVADVGKGQIVGADEADGAAVEKGADYTFGSGEAVFGVGSLEKFIEKEEDRGIVFGEVADLAETRDLGVEAGASLLERVVDEDACAYL